MASSSRARRARGSLTASLILDAAEDIARGGLDALTMRAVAAHLDAAPMALYRYFATKDDLLNALLDRVLGRFQPTPPSADWLDDLRSFTLAHRELLDRHPWALAGLFTHPTPGPNATRIGEALLAILRRAYSDNTRVVATFSGLLALNYGWTAFSSARETLPAGGAEQVRQSLMDLPASVFPHTLAVAAEMAAYGSDDHYAVVLDQLLEGIRAAATGTSSAR